MIKGNILLLTCEQLWQPQVQCGEIELLIVYAFIQYNTIIYLKSLHREWLPIHPSQGLMIKVLDIIHTVHRKIPCLFRFVKCGP